MTTALAMGAVAFLLTLVLGRPFVGFLRLMGVAKQVRPDELATHAPKTGTPTMGGLLFTFTASVLTGLLALTLYRETGRSILLPLG